MGLSSMECAALIEVTFGEIGPLLGVSIVESTCHCMVVVIFECWVRGRLAASLTVKGVATVGPALSSSFSKSRYVPVFLACEA